jgi:hypothetical protein
MNKPEKYKSIPVSQLKLRRKDSLTIAEKVQTTTILQKLMDLIKLQHS